MEARRASLLGSVVTTIAYGHFRDKQACRESDHVVSRTSARYGLAGERTLPGHPEVPIAAIRTCWIGTFERNRQRHFGPKKSESPNLPILLES